MKIYVAGAFTNKRRVRVVMQRLQDAGHEIVGDWTVHKTTRNQHILAREVMKDWHGVLDADLLVILWPGRWNTPVEMGIALGAKKLVYVIGKPNVLETIYMLHPLVTIVPSVNDLPILNGAWR